MHSTTFRSVFNRCIRINASKYVFNEVKQKYLSNSSVLYFETYSFNKRRLNKFGSINNTRTTSKEDDLVQLDDPDTFGLLGRSNIPTINTEGDEGDKIEEEYISNVPLHKDKLPMQKYAEMIKLHVANNRIKEAIDVLEVRMLKEDKVKPDSFIYNLLIGSCSRVGYTDKAFKLFNQMKRRGLNVSGGVYTSLFNACANSPWKEDGISRANKLRQLINEKSVPLNTTIYNCMIKAYGRCGDIKTAFSIVDEMKQLKIPMRTHTFNFLLQACISDKESGFRNALFVWRKMIALKEKPNIYSFNLLLRCIKECGFGNNENNNLIIKDLLSIKPYKKSNLLLNKKESIILPIFHNKQEIENTENSLTITSNNSPVQSMPNFLAIVPDMDSTVGFGNVNTVYDKYVMVGGVGGIFKEMNLYNVTPDIKTFTLLLEILPNSSDYDNKLLEAMKILKIKTDIDFYNMLMKRRCFRNDYQAAKDVLKMIDEENKIRKKKNRFIKGRKLLKNDIITYGVLAMCCDTRESAEEYVQYLSEQYIRINAQIAGSLLRQGLNAKDFKYVKFVIDLVKEKDIQVNNVFIDHLEQTMRICQDIMCNNPKHQSEFHSKFLSNFSKWLIMLKKVKLEEPENPWQQFKTNVSPRFQRFRDHVEFKKRIYKRKNMRIPKYKVKC